MSLSSLIKAVRTEEEAYQYLEGIRWPNGPICPHCGVIDHAYHLKPRNGERKTRTGKVTYRSLWKCAACGKQFSVLVGTIFERSKIPVSKWLLAFHLMCANKNGASAHELHRELNIGYEAAWFMCHRIRYALEQGTYTPMMETTVEVDETYVGGKHKGMRGRGAVGKTPVVTLVERNGDARSQVMVTVNAKNLRQAIRENVHPDAGLFTDGFAPYRSAAGGYYHATVDHTSGEYVRGSVHTNTAEGYFSQLKRSLDGTYHHVSAQHLHRYLAEFDFRYSTRKSNDGERAVAAIRKTTGKRLMYKDAIQKTETAE